MAAWETRDKKYEKWCRKSASYAEPFFNLTYHRYQKNSHRRIGGESLGSSWVLDLDPLLFAEVRMIGDLNRTTWITSERIHIIVGRGGLTVCALDSESRGPGSSPGRDQCRVLGQDTLLSQCLSPPGSINGYQQTVRETWRNAGR